MYENTKQPTSITFQLFGYNLLGILNLLTVFTVSASCYLACAVKTMCLQRLMLPARSRHRLSHIRENTKERKPPVQQLKGRETLWNVL